MAISKLEQIRQRYRQRFPERVSEMTAVFEEAQARTVPRQWSDDEPLAALRRFAHNMAGTAGSCGLGEAGAIARRIDVHLRGVQEGADIDAAAVEIVADFVATLRSMCSVTALGSC